MTKLMSMLLVILALCVSLGVVTANNGVPPIAMHQLIAVDTAGNAVIRLKGWDNTNPKMTYTLRSLPATGQLYQLSQVYSSHGIEPKAGVSLTKHSRTNVPVNVTGSNNRVYYTRPSPDVATVNRFDTFTYTVHNGEMLSYTGTVTIVPATTGALIGSDFLLSAEDWTIVGNKASTALPAQYEPYSRGRSLNHYIVGSDDSIHTTTAISSSTGHAKTDASLWFFHAPMRYYSNYGIAYMGTLSFTIAGFSGDFTALNNPATTSVVELECATCVGPVTRGIKLVYRLSTLLAKQKLNTGGGAAATTFTIDLTETAGWVKDTQNTLLSDWSAPSQCDMLQVLSGLSSMNILGDWTAWYETTALDNVAIRGNTKYAAQHGDRTVPLCGMVRPDASVCTC